MILLLTIYKLMTPHPHTLTPRRGGRGARRALSSSPLPSIWTRIKNMTKKEKSDLENKLENYSCEKSSSLRGFHFAKKEEEEKIKSEEIICMYDMSESYGDSPLYHRVGVGFNPTLSDCIEKINMYGFNYVTIESIIRTRIEAEKVKVEIKK